MRPGPTYFLHEVVVVVEDLAGIGGLGRDLVWADEGIMVGAGTVERT